MGPPSSLLSNDCIFVVGYHVARAFDKLRSNGRASHMPNQELLFAPTTILCLFFYMAKYLTVSAK